jgi:hypothetical protein
VAGDEGENLLSQNGDEVGLSAHQNPLVREKDLESLAGHRC